MVQRLPGSCCLATLGLGSKETTSGMVPVAVALTQESCLLPPSSEWRQAIVPACKWGAAQPLTALDQLLWSPGPAS